MIFYNKSINKIIQNFFFHTRVGNRQKKLLNRYLYKFSFNINKIKLHQLVIKFKNLFSASGQSSQTLNFVDMRLISNDECKRTFSPLLIQDTTLCAVGKVSTRQNVCQGDSGGPLVNKQGSEYVQVGVVSFVSVKGCDIGHPSGYARVSEFKTWISRNIGISVK